MKHTNTALALCLVMFLIALPAASAQTNPAAADPMLVADVENHLFALEQQAAQASNDAGQLWTLTRNHNTARGSHTYYLNNLREDINDMGKLLAELEYMKPQGSRAQQFAIERARTHLLVMAQRTSEALDLARAGSGNLTLPSYKETLEGLYEQADVLYQTLDTIGEYHDASEQFNKLESSPGGPVS